MALPDMKLVMAEVGKLEKFTDQHLIMLALAELIMANKDVPPGPKMALFTMLKLRAGALERQADE